MQTGEKGQRFWTGESRWPSTQSQGCIQRFLLHKRKFVLTAVSMCPWGNVPNTTDTDSVSALVGNQLQHRITTVHKLGTSQDGPLMSVCSDMTEWWLMIFDTKCTNCAIFKLLWLWLLMTTEQVKPVAQTMEHQPFPWCIFLVVHVSPLPTVAQTLAQCLWSHLKLRQTVIFHRFSSNDKHLIAYEQHISTLLLIYLWDSPVIGPLVVYPHIPLRLLTLWAASSQHKNLVNSQLWAHPSWFSSYGQDKQVNIHALPHKCCYACRHMGTSLLACSTHAHTQLFACCGADNELICSIYFNSCKTCTCTMGLMGHCCPSIIISCLRSRLLTERWYSYERVCIYRVASVRSVCPGEELERASPLPVHYNDSVNRGRRFWGGGG